MTLCVFVLIASEFMPVSLLTPLARDLGVTEGLAGQGIAISGALAVLTSLFLSRLAGNINRKHLLLGMTLLMAPLGDDYRFRPKPSGLHDRPRADRYRYRRVLVHVCRNGHSPCSAA
jgi:hypothetical protein